MKKIRCFVAIDGNNFYHSLKSLGYTHQLEFNFPSFRGYTYELGYLLRSDRLHEKGVDVKIAVDMVRGAYRNEFDCVILISSDTDLLPAVREVRENKKIVEYVGFSHRPSFAMMKYCNETRLLKKEDVEKFFPSKIKKAPPGRQAG